MRIIKVVPSRVWRHRPSGRTASLWGASPWNSETERAEWEVVERGWTWLLADGTVGLGRVPAATREEAEEIMRAANARDSRWKAWKNKATWTRCASDAPDDDRTSARCECGTVTGVRCEEVPAGTIVVVDWMPPYLRASHRAAGNAGRWPANGAERISVSRECLRQWSEEERAWVEEVQP